MGLLFFLQTLVGGASQHYRADISNFFGIDLARLLPFNIARTWHLQLAIFWVSTSYLAAGIFLAPMIAGREPRGQNFLAYGLLGDLTIVVFGSLFGEYAGIEGWFHNQAWIWFGNQGFESLDLGRFWQILLTVGLFFWVIILFRGLRGRLRSEHMGICLGSSSFLLYPSQRFTGLVCSLIRERTLQLLISGASGSCISGWKTSSSCSRQPWSPTCLCCSASYTNASR
jgi:nitric oxide reductase large subunit